MSHMILTPEQRVLVQANLDDARKSYHSLTTGTSAAVIVDQNGERVEFNVANSARLAAYIVALENQLSPVAAAQRILGPARFIF
jgi:gpW